MFQPQLWPEGREYWGGPFKSRKTETQDVKEVWFSGVHGDVGGGYPEGKSQLAKLPLEWMIAETKKMGLKYKTRTINEIVLGKNKKLKYIKPDPVASPNQSMNWAWAIIEFLPRRVSSSQPSPRRSMFGFYIPFFEARYIQDGAAIHKSVFERKGTSNDLDQPNIPVDHIKV